MLREVNLVTLVFVVSLAFEMLTTKYKLFVDITAREALRASR